MLHLPRNNPNTEDTPGVLCLIKTNISHFVSFDLLNHDNLIVFKVESRFFGHHSAVGLLLFLAYIYLQSVDRILAGSFEQIIVTIKCVFFKSIACRGFYKLVLAQHDQCCIYCCFFSSTFLYELAAILNNVFPKDIECKINFPDFSQILIKIP